MRKLKALLFVALGVVLFTLHPAQAENDPRDSKSPYGVLDFLMWDHSWNNHQYDSMEKIEQAARMMKAAGIGFIRMDFRWDDLEPRQGRFDFTKMDKIVEILGKNGIHILGTLDYNAVWESKIWNAPPDPEAFVRYALAVVHHYKGQVKYWEIWNEPDTASYWQPQDDMKTYVALLKVVYPALKEEDPTCKILLGGLTSNAPFSLKHVYAQGGGKFFDIVNFHPFTNPMRANALRIVHGICASVFETMRKNGDRNKPIWITELGCPGVANPAHSKGWWEGKSPSEYEQANWLATVYEEVPRWKRVQKVFWAFFRDTEHFGNDVDHFGLLREDFSPKPAYRVYRQIALGNKPRIPQPIVAEVAHHRVTVPVVGRTRRPPSPERVKFTVVRSRFKGL